FIFCILASISLHKPFVSLIYAEAEADPVGTPISLDPAANRPTRSESAQKNAHQNANCQKTRITLITDLRILLKFLKLANLSI
ncbi:unnamed protein product, partial [Pocillopora meandrina]